MTGLYGRIQWKESKRISKNGLKARSSWRLQWKDSRKDSMRAFNERIHCKDLRFKTGCNRRIKWMFSVKGFNESIQREESMKGFKKGSNARTQCKYWVTGCNERIQRTNSKKDLGQYWLRDSRTEINARIQETIQGTGSVKLVRERIYWEDSTNGFYTINIHATV